MVVIRTSGFTVMVFTLHFGDGMMTPPPEKQDAQVVDNQVNVLVLFLESLPPAGRGWSANKSLQATRDGGFSSASRFTPVGPACLSSGR